MRNNLFSHKEVLDSQNKNYILDNDIPYQNKYKYNTEWIICKNSKVLSLLYQKACQKMYMLNLVYILQ
jgi:hypothetical protein